MLYPARARTTDRFGADGEHGVASDGQGFRLVEVADVGEEALVVHDEEPSQSEPGVRLVASRDRSAEATPIGVFRAVERPDYGSLVDQQLLEARPSRRR